MVSSAIPIITFRSYPYKKKKLTFWVSLIFVILENYYFTGCFPGIDVTTQ